MRSSENDFFSISGPFGLAHIDTICVLLNMPKKHYRIGKTVKNLDQLLTHSLDLFLTFKHPHLEPAFNSTVHTHIYIYIYVYAVKLLAGPCLGFFNGY